MMYVCPVCGNSKLEHSPNNSQEMCMQCGIKFGVDDVTIDKDCEKKWQELRNEWIATGKPFWWESLKYLSKWEHLNH